MRGLQNWSLAREILCQRLCVGLSPARLMAEQIRSDVAHRGPRLHERPCDLQANDRTHTLDRLSVQLIKKLSRYKDTHFGTNTSRDYGALTFIFEHNSMQPLVNYEQSMPAFFFISFAHRQPNLNRVYVAENTNAAAAN
ncbi:hypothetical protein CBL_05511 [Carabus blaptoides fortunei]